MMKVTIKEGEGKKWCLQIKLRHIREECAVVSDGRAVVFHPFCGCGEVFSRFLQIYFLLTGYFSRFLPTHPTPFIEIVNVHW